MMPALKAFADRFLGRGDATITVPSFDGALKPNQILEKAETIGQFDAPEDLATDGKALYIADGSAVLRLDGTVATEVRRFDRNITALCCLPDGGIAAALDGREVQVFATPSASSPCTTISDPALNAINALSPGPQGTLIATDGSTARPYRQWVYDLMERGRSGKVLSLDIASGSVRPIASGLSFGFGACAAGEDVFVGESWRRRMMTEIDPEYWIAPKLKSGQSFLEPMQGAHIKTMGVVKPWAPPRSYGLVVRLDANGVPLYAVHSRVDGVNHGVVAAVEIDGSLFALAKGPGRLLRM